MSLATRCTACGTVFRIVEDQLRVSDGWVRCGRCSEIFDARELLFDIERDAPPPWPVAYSPQVMVEPPPPPPPPAPPPEPEPMWMPPPDPEPGPRMEALPTDWPSEAVGSRQEPRWVDTPPAALPPSGPPTPQAAELQSASAEPTPAPPSFVEMPEFMRQAESTARWNRPAVRTGLAIASLMLAALLLLQVTLHFRHALAALHPPLRGALNGLCSAFGCEVQPWRRIEALKIESHSMTAMGGGNYRLTLVLSNKTPVDVAAPWVELKLSDAQGTPFTRRALEPSLLSPSLRQINADSEQTLTFSFSAGGQAISGYTVGVFHP